MCFNVVERARMPRWIIQRATNGKLRPEGTPLMRWDRDHRSDDVIDPRRSGGGAPVGAGVGILFWLASRFGLPGLVLGGVILAAGYFLTPSGDSRSAVSPSSGERGAAAQDETAAFVGFVLDDVQSTWQQIFAQEGRRYVPAKVVL